MVFCLCKYICTCTTLPGIHLTSMQVHFCVYICYMYVTARNELYQAELNCYTFTLAKAGANAWGQAHYTHVHVSCYSWLLLTCTCIMLSLTTTYMYEQFMSCTMLSLDESLYCKQIRYNLNNVFMFLLRYDCVCGSSLQGSRHWVLSHGRRPTHRPISSAQSHSSSFFQQEQQRWQ